MLNQSCKKSEIEAVKGSTLQEQLGGYYNLCYLRYTYNTENIIIVNNAFGNISLEMFNFSFPTKIYTLTVFISCDQL